jgi:hypothetical protein
MAGLIKEEEAVVDDIRLAAHIRVACLKAAGARFDMAGLSIRYAGLGFLLMQFLIPK